MKGNLEERKKRSIKKEREKYKVLISSMVNGQVTQMLPIDGIRIATQANVTEELNKIGRSGGPVTQVMG